MSDDLFFRNIIRLLVVWSIMSTLTYGHAYQQELKEDKILCAKVDKDPHFICEEFKEPAIVAWAEAVAWPYHWSAYLWGRYE